MSSKGKDEASVAATGEGSRVANLPPQQRKHIEYATEGLRGVHLRWSTTSIRKFPAEIFDNEEVANFATIFDAPNNALRTLPGNIANLANLEHVDVHHNQLTHLPASIG